MEKRLKFISEIEGMENFKDYAIDTDGIVYSFKNNKKRILKPSWKRRVGDKRYGKYVCLIDSYGKIRSFTIARLVSLAFIPTDNTNRAIRYINGDRNDNRVSNLEWYYTLPKNEKEKVKVDNFIIENELLNKIKNLHNASIQKGLKVPDTNEFLNKIVDDAIQEYAMRYGLRRFLMN